MNNRIRRSFRRAMTLVEILTVVAIISLIMSMLVPAVNVAREAGRRVTCQNNLRQFGIGMHERATRYNGVYCTGAFDWAQDGALTDMGWVADLVNDGQPVGKMLCPTNSARMSATYNDLLRTDVSGWTDTTCVNRLGRPPETLPDGSTRTNPCRLLITEAATYAAGTDERKQLVEREVLKRHFNTNYTASWFLVRGGVVLSASGNPLSVPSTCPRSVTSRNSTFGPYSAMSMGRIASTTIPLLGCGAPVDQLAVDLNSTLTAGTQMVRPMTRGPVQRGDLAYLTTFPGGTPKTGESGWWASWNATMQDYRYFAPVHRNTCNILFADGSVRNFVDENRDFYLNNGFDATSGGGFADSTVELGEDEVHSGWSIRGQ